MKIIDKFLPSLHKTARRVLLIGKTPTGNFEQVVLNNSNGLGSQQYQDGGDATPPLLITLIGGKITGSVLSVADIDKDNLHYSIMSKRIKSVEADSSLMSGVALNGGNCIVSNARNTNDAGLRQVWVTVQFYSWTGTPAITIELQVAASNISADSNWTTIKTITDIVENQTYNLNLNEDDLFKFFRVRICDTGSGSSTSVYIQYFPVK